MPDLGCPASTAAIDLAVDNQPAADAGADGDVNDGRQPLAGAEERLGQAGDVRVVTQDRGQSRDVADPVGEREIVPALDLMRLDDGPGGVINRAAEADAGSLQ